jgi:hypothetical protein
MLYKYELTDGNEVFNTMMMTEIMAAEENTMADLMAAEENTMADLCSDGTIYWRKANLFDPDNDTI